MMLQDIPFHIYFFGMFIAVVVLAFILYVIMHIFISLVGYKYFYEGDEAKTKKTMLTVSASVAIFLFVMAMVGYGINRYDIPAALSGGVILLTLISFYPLIKDSCTMDAIYLFRRHDWDIGDLIRGKDANGRIVFEGFYHLHTLRELKFTDWYGAEIKITYREIKDLIIENLSRPSKNSGKGLRWEVSIPFPHGGDIVKFKKLLNSVGDLLVQEYGVTKYLITRRITEHNYMYAFNFWHRAPKKAWILQNDTILDMIEARMIKQNLRLGTQEILIGDRDKMQEVVTKTSIDERGLEGLQPIRPASVLQKEREQRMKEMEEQARKQMAEEEERKAREAMMADNPQQEIDGEEADVL